MIPVLALLAATAQAQPAAEPNGRALFENHCTSCHASGDERIPTVEELRARTPEAIVTALTSGAMQVQGGELNAAEKRAVAEYLAGRIVGARTNVRQRALHGGAAVRCVGCGRGLGRVGTRTATTPDSSRRSAPA